MRTWRLTTLLAALGACGCARPEGVVSVAAASSLREVLAAAAPGFEAEHPGVELEFAFEASSTIARQLEAGAGFDVFLSADPVSLDRVKERLDARTRTSFLSNRLVLVAAPAPDGGLGTLADLADTRGRIAVALPSVPAGRYMRVLLAERGLLAALEPRFVQARNVRATLGLVVSGAAPYGFVYLSDQQVAGSLEVLWTAPAGEPPIAYVGAARRGADPAARLFLDWLSSDAFQAAAAEHGFTPRGS